ncbi:MAG: bacteriohemerythrin [Mariprofundaceae bacterium]|nr:bacteriohemerythrin [Mariprofundaceae bacterium]
MESFHWNQHFVTQLPAVDQQHHHLVDIINEFGRLLAGNTLVFDDIEALFQQLTSYAQYHFQEEEALMSQFGIDQRHFQHHVNKHRGFLQDVLAMHAGISSDNLNAAGHLLEFLTQWLAYHILGSDQDMARQIRAIQAGKSPGEAYESEEKFHDSATAPLLTALNTLFQQVSSRNKELVQVNQSLEKKVAERTRELSEANRHLEELTLTDPLTGLPNRRYAMRQLATLWNESLKTDTPLSCMMIDADHFKEVNDTCGHDTGDIVLCELSKALCHTARADDIVCRLGGDEFLMICPDTDQSAGMVIAELTRKAVSELRVPTGAGAWNGSISIGLATRSPDMKDCEALLKKADMSVYESKRDGKNCVRAVG